MRPTVINDFLKTREYSAIIAPRAGMEFNLLIEKPAGDQQEIATKGYLLGMLAEDTILWAEELDGPLPSWLATGAVERIECIELLKDENGKQLYDIIVTGPHRTNRVKSPRRQAVTYLRNKITGRKVRSEMSPKPIKPEGALE
jgi:hypothetical protein